MSTDPRRVTCRYCRARIVLGRPGNAKPMPLDEPDPLGNCAVHIDHMGNVRVRVLRKNEEPASHEIRWRPHWATCTTPPPKRRRPATPPTIKTKLT